MKREIIFRGKSLNDGKWIEGDLIQSTEDKFAIWQKESETLLGSIGVNPETVGQYTGLKDKNGKMIFEGDIVKLNDNADFEIKWNQLHACYGLYWKGNMAYEMLADICDSKGKTPKEWTDSSIEVI